MWTLRRVLARCSRMELGLDMEDAGRYQPRLIDIANERGGKDNITAIVVAIPEEETEGANDVALGYGTLANMPFFRFLEPRELLRVQALAKPRVFNDNEIVVKEGDPGESIFVVLKGEASVRKGENRIAALGAGEHFGEMALVDKTPRSATVVSQGKSHMLDGPEPDDSLHNPDPHRDRLNDRGGTIFSTRGLMNLGCILVLAVGIIALLYDVPPLGPLNDTNHLHVVLAIQSLPISRAILCRLLEDGILEASTPPGRSLPLWAIMVSSTSTRPRMRRPRPTM